MCIHTVTDLSTPLTYTERSKIMAAGCGCGGEYTPLYCHHNPNPMTYGQPCLNCDKRFNDLDDAARDLLKAFNEMNDRWHRRLDSIESKLEVI